MHEPLQTGIKAIDAMTPIGRGQRQLIIGDRQTGKTTIAIDTIINQKQNWESGDPDKQVRCIYVAIGQKGSTIAAVRGALEEAGALEYTTIVAAPASDSAGFKYLAPYTGSAIGQHWMYDGKHVLIVFDDLTKQAEAYRAVSLLLRRPPGREAYPGDVFYLHSRLLERCAKLSDELGARLDDRPADHRDQGQRRLGVHPDQRHLDHRRPDLPAVRPVQRQPASGDRRRRLGLAGRWRRADQGDEEGLRLAQGRPGAVPRAWRRSRCSPPTSTPASRQQLARGARLMELLKQPQYSPYPVEEQVVSIWAGTTGQLDEVPVEDVLRFESEFLDYLRRSTRASSPRIRETRSSTDDTEAAASRTRTTRSSTSSRPPTASRIKAGTRRARGAGGRGRRAGADRQAEAGLTRWLVSAARATARGSGRRESTKKITRAMELIAASRIVKAQQRAQAAAPYARELTRAVSAVATYSNVDHPLTTEPENPKRAAVLVVTSRPRAGRRLLLERAQGGRALAEQLRGEGKEVVPYLVGRKARRPTTSSASASRAASGPASPTSRPSSRRARSATR